jgi:hypothetical protein
MQISAQCKFFAFFNNNTYLSTKMNSAQYKKTEEAISKAVEAYATKKNQKILELAKEFDVPYHRLRR